METIKEDYLSVLRNYAVLEGRERRRVYWTFAVVNLVLYGILAMLDMDLLYVVLGLALIVPNITVGVRRLHDTGRSGWWLLISLVPVVGFIVLLVFLLQEGHAGDNEYGPDPKEEEEFTAEV